jgi:hypothetical protein
MRPSRRRPDVPNDQKKDLPHAHTAPNTVWEILNKPLTLWLLTSVLISLMGFSYTSYNACRTSLLESEQRLMKLYGEFYVRTARLKHIVDNAKTASDEKILTYINEALNPDKTFVFLEFKGRTLYDLHAQIYFLENRWGIYQTRMVKALSELPDLDRLNDALSARDATYFRELKLPSLNELIDVDNFQIAHSCLRDIVRGR